MSTDHTPETRSDECDCCRFKTDDLESYHLNVGTANQSKRWLCALCAGTMTSTYDKYPRQHDSDLLQVMKTICYVGNVILAEVRK